MKRTRIIPFLLACAVLFFPANAMSKTDARCGLSVGVVAGPTIPRDPDLKDEFKALYHFEANVKYYFLSVFSGSLDLGYEYGKGAPRHFLDEGENITLDGRGISFLRAMPYWATLRLEPLRRYPFNPYLGGGVGGKYVVLDRRGYQRQITFTDSGDEWLLGWMALVGFDVMISDFVFFRFDARYTSEPSKSVEFFEKKDMGGYDFLAGINIYF